MVQVSINISICFADFIDLSFYFPLKTIWIFLVPDIEAILRRNEADSESLMAIGYGAGNIRISIIRQAMCEACAVLAV
jgi:hypothetical protein